MRDPNVVLRAASLCDDLGIDAISAGGTLAWAMECRERGVDLGVPAEAIPRWGDGEALLRTLRAIGAREGLGDLLAEGSRAASARVGQGSGAWAAAARINQIKKRFNMAQGWTRALDTLPPRLLQAGGEQPPIDPGWLERQIAAYYAVRGWDGEGRPAEVSTLQH